MFVQVVNPITGKVEWVVKEDADAEGCYSDIAASGYSDMLHDQERNDAYRAAIHRAVSERGAQTVLDIGTGTGLLAMYATQAGAEHAYACEVYQPMADIADQMFRENRAVGGDRVTLIRKRSTDISASGSDMPSRADMVVAEVLDSDLLGEGVLPTYAHAKQHLLKAGATLIPCGATVMAQLVESPPLAKMHSPRKGGLGRFTMPVDTTCRGLPFSLQAHADSPALGVKPLTEPFVVKEVVFGSDETRGAFRCPVTVSATGTVHAVLMWWNLHLDEVTSFSTAPSWVDGGGLQWRDHWKQCVHFVGGDISLHEGAPVVVLAQHDAERFWFTVEDADVASPATASPPSSDGPLCHCGLHTTWGRERMGMLNDGARFQAYAAALHKEAGSRERLKCLCVSDGPFGSLIACTLASSQVLALESTPNSAAITRRALEANQLSARVEVTTESAEAVAQRTDARTVEVLLGEPYFKFARLPWDNLTFWYARTHLDGCLAPGARILPMGATLKAMLVSFEHFHTLRRPVEVIDGVDFSVYNRLVTSTDVPDAPFSVWDHGFTALSAPVSCLEFDFMRVVEDVQGEVEVPILHEGQANGWLFWLSYRLDEATTALDTEERLRMALWHRPAARITPVDVSVSPDRGAAKVVASFRAADAHMEILAEAV